MHTKVPFWNALISQFIIFFFLLFTNLKKKKKEKRKKKKEAQRAQNERGIRRKQSQEATQSTKFLYSKNSRHGPGSSFLAH